MAAYLISDVIVRNAEAFQTYRTRAEEAIVKYGGRYLARGGAVQALEGVWSPRNIVIVAFGSMALTIVVAFPAAYSLGHGGNDAQKTMGIIVAALVATGHLTVRAGAKPEVPFWVVLACHAAMGLGTLSGGWRIVRTMGMRITKLTPVGGFCAETSGAATLFLATSLGIPVSTTHTITGAIVGVGAAHRLTAVRWGVTRHIVGAWLLTIPGAALLGAGLYHFLVPLLR